MAKDVRAGGIAGTVQEEPRSEVRRVALSVTLSASTAALRSWLERRGDALFAQERPLLLRRLSLR